MIWYGVVRAIVESFRFDAWTIGSIATAQWISIVLIVIGVVGLVIRHRPRERTQA
jgi:phosphatidylglycerol:prolipoprotein diacylglycerol transferase